MYYVKSHPSPYPWDFEHGVFETLDSYFPRSACSHPACVYLIIDPGERILVNVSPSDLVPLLLVLQLTYHSCDDMAEMELQGAHKAVNHQDHGFVRTFTEDNDEQQQDVLARLGKRPILKVSSLIWVEEERCGADTRSAISVSYRLWALHVPS